MKRMLKPFILFYLCAAIIIAALAQREANKPSAELILLKQKSDKDTTKVSLLLRLSEYYFSKVPKVSTDLDISLAYARSSSAIGAEGVRLRCSRRRGAQPRKDPAAQPGARPEAAARWALRRAPTFRASRAR